MRVGQVRCHRLAFAGENDAADGIDYFRVVFGAHDEQVAADAERGERDGVEAEPVGGDQHRVQAFVHGVTVHE